MLALGVTVAGGPWGSSSRETVRQFENGELSLSAPGVWYEGANENGARKLVLYPTPGGGVTLELEWVFAAPDLTVDTPSAEPDEFPEWFHPKLVHFVGEIYYATVEDNPELAESQKSKADLAVSELVRYDNERGAGDGIFTISIAGISG